jgi:hypothetical protein
MNKKCFGLIVLLTVTFLMAPSSHARAYQKSMGPDLREPLKTALKRKTPLNQSKVYLAQADSGEKDLAEIKGKEQRNRLVKRGIGGVTTGHAVGAIKQTYGGSYGGLVHTFFEIAGNVGGSQLLSDPDTSESYDQDQVVEPEGETPWTNEGVAATSQELQVEIDVVKEVYQGGRYQARQIVDGDTLTQNDNYKVMFRCNMGCYMYIAQLDSTGKMDPIFPSRYFSWGNPVEPHTAYSLPPDNKWFYLDENTGVETIYFIASRSRRPDLERLFHTFEEQNKSLVQRAPVSLDSSVVITRGIGGVRPGRTQEVSFQDGSQGRYSSTLFSSIQADFVMTRWFYHR